MKIVMPGWIQKPRKDAAAIPGLVALLKSEEEKMTAKYGLVRVQRRSRPSAIPGREEILTMEGRKKAIHDKFKKRQG